MQKHKSERKKKYHVLNIINYLTNHTELADSLFIF